MIKFTNNKFIIFFVQDLSPNQASRLIKVTGSPLIVAIPAITFVSF